MVTKPLAKKQRSSSTRALFAGGGAMGALMHGYDWAASPLGPVRDWPPSLHTTVSLALSSPFPTVIFWGPELVMLYNDAYLPMLADKHPASLGQAARECWPEIWEIIGPMLHGVLETGQATWSYDLLLPIIHEGAVGEHYFTFSYSPIRDEAGVVRGVFCPVIETTVRVQGERREHALRREADAAREQITATLESITDAFYTVDRDWRFTYVNQRAKELWGRPHDVFLGKTLWEEFPEAESLIFGHQLRTAMAEQVTIDVEGFYPPLGIWLALRAYPSVEGLAVYFQDLTARMRAEHAVRDSEARYRGLFESIDEGFCVIEPVLDAAGEPVEFRYVEANPAFTAQSGGRHVIGKTIREVFPNEPQEWIDIYATVLTTGEPRRFERLLVTHGRILDLYAFRIAEGTQRRVAVLFTDITKRKQAEEASLRLAAIVESSDDAIISKSLDGVVTSWNAAAERIFGYRAEEMIGQSIVRLIPEERHEEEPRILERLRRGERVDHFETIRRTKEGRLLDVSVTISPLRNEHGTIIGASKIARDITKQKQLEKELAQRAAELERLNAELQQFGYIVSHDLQEPLRTITNFVRLLATHLQGTVDAEAAELIKFTVEGAQRMQALITDLLAYTRVSGPRQPFTVVDSEALLARVLGDLQLTLHEREAEVTHDALPLVQGNAGQLGLVLQNLIGNAVKFRSTAPPRIHIAARRAGAQWVFTVRDNGIGIEPQHAERIFQVFQRLHPRSEYPGTGIGLAICQKIIERHGGRIWVESAVGHGATFFFTLPTPSPPPMSSQTVVEKETCDAASGMRPPDK